MRCMQMCITRKVYAFLVFDKMIKLLYLSSFKQYILSILYSITILLINIKFELTRIRRVPVNMNSETENIAMVSVSAPCFNLIKHGSLHENEHLFHKKWNTERV